MDERIEMIVSADHAGLRIDTYLCANTDFSRSRIAALIQEGAVTLHGKVISKPSVKTEPGQHIVLSLPEIKAAAVLPENIPIEILYQDKDVVIVNKACGMVVHPAVGNETGTLVNALLYHVHDLSGIGGEMRPGIVHRLDKDTSGLILIAKNDQAHAILSDQFKERSMEKHYRAIAFGRFKEDFGLIDAPIARHPADRKKMAIVKDGRPSKTEWRILQQYASAAYLDVHLLTGRTHQIRVHMQSVGHPLLGDPIYAPNIKSPVHIPRLMLHAYSLAFTHPSTGNQMEFVAPIPKEFEIVLQKLG